MNKYFSYKNPNPLKKENSDCVVRALCLSSNKEWTAVYSELFVIGLELKAMQNDKETYEMWLKQNGYTYTGISNKKGSKRPTVTSFTKEHKTGKFVLITAGHLVAVVDGIFYDIWDCGEKSLYGYWELIG